MKKNLIYTVAFLLCGSFFLSSCQDMLNVESDRVEYEFDGWTASDSVYSVLGILKSVQGVADRQILLNELRADLISLSKEKAVVDVQEISNSKFINVETNKYLDVKDYYKIINNCNVYLNRVDTTLKKNGQMIMMPEYVAVKSVRAWTYLQLAINYNHIPFYTDPILTHHAAEEVMNRPKLSREEVIDRLIADILPYENPAVYPMPAWDDGGKVIPFGYKNTLVETRQLFVPIRMLLGEMYLWKGDYVNAAKCFYAQIVGHGTNNSAPKYTDNGNVIKYSSMKGKNINDSYSQLFGAKKFSDNSSKFITIIPFAENELIGTTSDLASVFAPQNEVGGAQVYASPALISLARSQVYLHIDGDPENASSKKEYGDSYEYPGDLRIKATTYSQISDDLQRNEYKNIIAKFNLEESNYGMNNTSFVPNLNTTFIILQRSELAYLRLAEALVGMERENYSGALEAAMLILKEGVKQSYPLYQNRVDSLRAKLDEKGKIIYKYTYNEDGTKADSVPEMEKYVYSFTDSLNLDFSDQVFERNIGIHSRGTGNAEHNAFYALDSACVARYYGIEEPTYEDSIKYMRDLVLDELALELSWEGTRFGDLIRFAKAANDVDVLAKRIAGRDFSNEVKYNSPEFQLDIELYNKMKNEENWYLILPDEIVDPDQTENGKAE